MGLDLITSEIRLSEDVDLVVGAPRKSFDELWSVVDESVILRRQRLVHNSGET